MADQTASAEPAASMALAQSATTFADLLTAADKLVAVAQSEVDGPSKALQEEGPLWSQVLASVDTESQSFHSAVGELMGGWTSQRESRIFEGTSDATYKAMVDSTGNAGPTGGPSSNGTIEQMCTAVVNYIALNLTTAQNAKQKVADAQTAFLADYPNGMKTTFQSSTYGVKQSAPATAEEAAAVRLVAKEVTKVGEALNRQVTDYKDVGQRVLQVAQALKWVGPDGQTAGPAASAGAAPTGATAPGGDAGQQPGGDQAGADQTGSDQAGDQSATGADQAGADQAGGDQAGGDQAGGDQAGGDQAATGGDQAGDTSGGNTEVPSGGTGLAGDQTATLPPPVMPTGPGTTTPPPSPPAGMPLTPVGTTPPGLTPIGGFRGGTAGLGGIKGTGGFRGTTGGLGGIGGIGGGKTGGLGKTVTGGPAKLDGPIAQAAKVSAQTPVGNGQPPGSSVTGGSTPPGSPSTGAGSPMMPPMGGMGGMAGAGAGGGRGGKSGAGAVRATGRERNRASGPTPGVPAGLRGKSGKSTRENATAVRRERDAAETLEVLDEDLWTVEAAEPAQAPAVPRRLRQSGL